MTNADAATSTALEQRIVDTIRVLSLDAVQKARSGHPGMPMGCADLATVLWTRHLRVDPAWPEWPGRDRFVLSAGHGSMLLYSMLHLAGFDLPLEEIERFRQWGSLTPGHPEHGLTPGVETTTGPLGQGFANAVGMAMAERHLAARFPGGPDGDAGHRTFVVTGDGDLMEGVSAEAASIAGHLRLSRLVVLYDANEITIDGSTGLTFSEDVGARFAAQRWHVVGPVDGHDREALDGALSEAVEEGGRPSLIVARTRIARGSPSFEGSHKSHGAPLGEEEVRLVKERLGFDPDASFVVPDEVRDHFATWREARAADSAEWRQRLEAWRESSPAECSAWEAALDGSGPGDPLAGVPEWKTGEKVATRAASGKVLQVAAANVPEIMPGSADLFESNKTALPDSRPFSADDAGGRNVYYGVREHAMGSIANGLVLHGGVRPVTSTFLVFADYMRPAIRLAALMELPVIHVFTHDSVHVGEDGPTHQPIEHLDALRVIPGLAVVRPADARETVSAWRYALVRRDGPTALIFTRQGLPVLERPSGPDIPAPVGLAGVVHQTEGGAPGIVLVASGSEVSLCREAAEQLERDGLRVRVVSVPCLEDLAAAPAESVAALLPVGPPRLFVEAGTGYTWGEWMRDGDGLHAIRRFGASAPGAEVADRLGLSPEAVRSHARTLVG